MGFSSVSSRTELVPVLPRPGLCPLPNLSISGHVRRRRTLPPAYESAEQSCGPHSLGLGLLVSWSLPYSGVCYIWSGPGYLASLPRPGFSGRATGLGWGWRPQGSPFMILVWAAPCLQETPPFQQEECRLRHFQLPAWAAGGGWRADP